MVNSKRKIFKIVECQYFDLFPETLTRVILTNAFSRCLTVDSEDQSVVDDQIQFGLIYLHPEWNLYINLSLRFTDGQDQMRVWNLKVDLSLKWKIEAKSTYQKSSLRPVALVTPFKYFFIKPKIPLLSNAKRRSYDCSKFITDFVPNSGLWSSFQ